MAKQLLTPLRRLIAHMNFSLKNYSCELVNLTGTVGKVELIPTSTTAVCETWNVSDKYTWDNVGHPWTRLAVRIIGVIKTQFFDMVMYVFDNSNLSQEIFAIDTQKAVICSLGHGRRHMLKPGFHYTANATTTTQKQSDYKVEQSSLTLIALF